mmetsp:Transcript_4581/g.11099  ORF Transcript_4581/g.11099 Transcript_4581/m.11099 type:complete len:232 (+) Transcript_4581:43-738(+)
MLHLSIVRNNPIQHLSKTLPAARRKPSSSINEAPDMPGRSFLDPLVTPVDREAGKRDTAASCFGHCATQIADVVQRTWNWIDLLVTILRFTCWPEGHGVLRTGHAYHCTEKLTQIPLRRFEKVRQLLLHNRIDATAIGRPPFPHDKWIFDKDLPLRAHLLPQRNGQPSSLEVHIQFINNVGKHNHKAVGGLGWQELPDARENIFQLRRHLRVAAGNHQHSCVDRPQFSDTF